MDKKKTRMTAAGLGLCILVCTIGVGVIATVNGLVALYGGMDTSGLPYQDSPVPHRTDVPDSYTGPNVVEHRTDLVSWEEMPSPYSWRIITPD